MGTTQASQCPDPLNSVFEQERKFFEKIWKDIITQADKSEPITFVPEYGYVDLLCYFSALKSLLTTASTSPFPYHPIGSVMTFSELADKEGARLQTLFEEWASSS
jgi:hypothetical protein